MFLAWRPTCKVVVVPNKLYFSLHAYFFFFNNETKSTKIRKSKMGGSFHTSSILYEIWVSNIFWRLLPMYFYFTSISLIVRTNKNMISFHKHVHTLSSTHFNCSIFERIIMSIFTNWMKMIHNLLANECNLCFGYTRALQFGSICKTIHLNKLQRAVNFRCL